MPYTSKASRKREAFLETLELLRKIGNNEWNRHGQWRFPFVYVFIIPRFTIIVKYIFSAKMTIGNNEFCNKKARTGAHAFPQPDAFVR
jgi:hypothetical protein